MLVEQSFNCYLMLLVVTGSTSTSISNARPSQLLFRKKRTTARPVYSPGHEYNDTDWRFQQSEVDIIDQALHDYCADATNKWLLVNQRTVIMNGELIAKLIAHGGKAKDLGLQIQKRPAAGSKYKRDPAAAKKLGTTRERICRRWAMANSSMTCVTDLVRRCCKYVLVTFYVKKQ